MRPGIWDHYNTQVKDEKTACRAIFCWSTVQRLFGDTLPYMTLNNTHETCPEPNSCKLTLSSNNTAFSLDDRWYFSVLWLSCWLMGGGACHWILWTVQGMIGYSATSIYLLFTKGPVPRFRTDSWVAYVPVAEDSVSWLCGVQHRFDCGLHLDYLLIAMYYWIQSRYLSQSYPIWSSKIKPSVVRLLDR